MKQLTAQQARLPTPFSLNFGEIRFEQEWNEYRFSHLENSVSFEMWKIEATAIWLSWLVVEFKDVTKLSGFHAELRASSTRIELGVPFLNQEGYTILTQT